MRWKAAWNRPTFYLMILIGIAVAVFGLIAGQQRPLLFVFLVIGILYIAICFLLLYLARRAE
ncbi:MAG TPA: hypothetical protein VFA09_25055 [Ktedonobacteraceae bacterium]|nr:hypothetical protein [Ktedonobacteraceae bacterium]